MSCIPIGLISPYAGGIAGAPAPEGWLFCRGQQVSRSVYSALFAVTGTYYGVGDGVNTFNVPDARGRVMAAPDDGMERLTAYSMSSVGPGGVGGEEKHTLTEIESPAHGHTISVSNTPVEDSDTFALALTTVEDQTVLKDTSGFGGGQPHLNVQPTLIVGGAIIFFGG